MQEIDFDATVDLIIAKDPRFARDAYTFVREALDFTKAVVHKEARESNEQKHVSGQELLEGIRQCALKEFGPMTTTVFEAWGVNTCRDFGEIVFNMVENRLLAKKDQDTRDDFQNGYDFTEAFRRPFWPQNRMKTGTKPVTS